MFIMMRNLLEWKFSYESFNSLPPSSVFEEHYSSDIFDIKNKNEIIDDLSPSSIRFRSGIKKMIFYYYYIVSFQDIIKTEHIDLDPIVNLDRDLPSSPLLSSFIIENVKPNNILGLSENS